MAERHATAMFSEAFDGALDARRRERFDTHLASCAPCAAAFAEYAAALDTLRALPPARMPVAVHLPSTPPRAARRGLPWSFPSLTPARLAYATGGLAAAALLVSVGVAVSHRGGQDLSTANRPQAAGALAPAAPSKGADTAGFVNRVTVSIPGRPDAVLVLATDRTTYAPGATVRVIAHVVVTGAAGAAAGPVAPAPATAGPGGGNVNSLALPDTSVIVRLLTAGASGTTSLGAATTPVAGTLAPGAPAAQQPAPLAIAVPLGGAEAEGGPVLVLTIPAGAHAGDRLQVVATLDAGSRDAFGYSSNGGSVTATLSLLVG